MGIYQHYRKHEHPFVNQVLSWKNQVETTYTRYLTDFLDPREQEIISLIIGTNNDLLQFGFAGGVADAEMKRAIIAPYYEEILVDDYDMTLLEATYPSQFIQLQHRDILGAFMSLGIERSKLGDIRVSDGIFQLIVPNELVSYIQINLTKINHAPIKLKAKSMHEMIPSQDIWQERRITMSSLRLDVALKEIYQMSRNDALKYIKGNRVKVNFTMIDDPAVGLLAGDLISVRGHGRSKLIEILGTTRKDKYSVKTARLKG